MGNITGKQSHGHQLVSHMRAEVADVDSQDRSETTKPSVMYVSYAETGFTNVWPAGNGTVIDEIITMAGGKNVFAGHTSVSAHSPVSNEG